MAEQPYVTFHDGNTYPQTGLGVWQVPNDEASANVQEALKVGYRHIDSAYGYGNEKGVGAGVRASGLPRDEVRVTSKLTNSAHGYDKALRMFEESYENLDLGPIDLFLIHWPVPGQGLYLDTWRAFVKLQQEGRIKSIGVSNFHKEHLERIIGETGVTPVCDQIELHPKFQQRELREYLAERNILVESWSPLGSGRLIGDETLVEIGRKHGKSSAQVMIRWHLQQGLIVLPKSVTPSRVRENFDVFDFELDDRDMQTIAGMDSAEGRNGPNPDTFNNM